MSKEAAPTQSTTSPTGVPTGSLDPTVPIVVSSKHYTVTITTDPFVIKECQLLRYSVFASELGALLRSPFPRMDVDEFDEFCEHVVVRDRRSDSVVGTYRLLPPGGAALTGRWYAESEFELSGLRTHASQLVEAGRSCVHPDHRGGAVINLLWAAIANYMVRSGHRWLAGCASVPLRDGGYTAAGVLAHVVEHAWAPEELRVQPLQRCRLPEPPAAPTPLPPLLRGYLRLGAMVCGEPALDSDFGVADFFVLLDLTRMPPRYLQYYVGLAEASERDSRAEV